MQVFFGDKKDIVIVYYMFANQVNVYFCRSQDATELLHEDLVVVRKKTILDLL